MSNHEEVAKKDLSDGTTIRIDTYEEKNGSGTCTVVKVEDTNTGEEISHRTYHGSGQVHQHDENGKTVVKEADN